MALSAALVIATAGCGGRSAGVELARVGPIAAGPANGGSRGEGYLKVYTATVQVNDGGTLYLKHTPYSVYDAVGRKARSIANSVGPNDQKPMTVTLPPGDYVIYGRAEGYGRVKVPITISHSRLTEVHLEYNDLPEKDKLAPADRVLLPDGRVVGRRAKD